MSESMSTMDLSLWGERGMGRSRRIYANPGETHRYWFVRPRRRRIQFSSWRSRQGHLRDGYVFAHRRDRTRQRHAACQAPGSWPQFAWRTGEWAWMGCMAAKVSLFMVGGKSSRNNL